jgi:hypothetical protein
MTDQVSSNFHIQAAFEEEQQVEGANPSQADPKMVSHQTSKESWDNSQEEPERAELMERVKGIYDENRLYHGTTLAAKESIRESGFDKNRKVSGAFEGGLEFFNDSPEVMEELSNNTQQNHHFSSDKETSRLYAGLAAKGASIAPAMVRTLGIRHDFSLENDQDAGDSDQVAVAWRTPSDIPRNYIIGSKKSDSGEDAAIFQRELQRANIVLPESKAGQLLREVQSDSDEDFSDSDEDFSDSDEDFSDSDEDFSDSDEDFSDSDEIHFK